MYRYTRRDGRTHRVDRYTGRRWRRVRPRSRAVRWLLWLLVLIVVLIILSQLFGGFQKGTKVGGLGSAPATVTAPRQPAVGHDHGSQAVTISANDP
ncbi:MAG: hypothetical protein JO345_29875 [Streptosporangiaceae bacterium]|nr:hypothetical protein [Streptosporangiaceae bacterium]